MKKILAILFSLFLVFQPLYLEKIYSDDQNKTLVWDEIDDPEQGFIEYEVYLIEVPPSLDISDLKGNMSNYMFFARARDESVIVEFSRAFLDGDYAIAIRTVLYNNGVRTASDFAYSDEASDVYDAPFFLRYTKGTVEPEVVLFQ
jgi:hypothetical protein